MKYVFLDVDGVLNNIHTKEHNPSGYPGVSRELVCNLARIIKETGAVIVLTSDWKIGWETFEFYCSADAKYLNKMLANEGLKIYGKTYDEHVYDQFFEDRGKGIKKFLLTQKDVESYVVIDDILFSDFDDQIKARLVKVDSEKGLTEENARQAIEILSGAID